MSTLAAPEEPEPECYSYDPPAPPSLPSAGGAGADAEAEADAASASADIGKIVTFAIDARGAFEVFMGRRYDPAERGDGGDSLLIAQHSLVPSHERFDAFARHMSGKLEAGLAARAAAAAAGGGKRAGAGAGTGVGALPRRLESPLERYSRLHLEIAQLQAELRAVEEGDRRRAPGTTAIDHASGVFGLLTAGSKEIAERLQALEAPATAAAATQAIGVAGSGVGASAVADADAVAQPDASSPAAALAQLRALQADVAGLAAAQAAMARACEAVRLGVASVERRLADVMGTASPPPRAVAKG